MSMNAQQNTTQGQSNAYQQSTFKAQQSFQSNPFGISKTNYAGEDSPIGGGAQTPSMSMHQDMASEMGGEDADMQGINSSKTTSIYKVMQECMDLDDMVCRSICSFDNLEIRKKLANQIILVGGSTKLKGMVDVLEDQIMNKFTTSYDENIERVDIIQINV